MLESTGSLHGGDAAHGQSRFVSISKKRLRFKSRSGSSPIDEDEPRRLGFIDGQARLRRLGLRATTSTTDDAHVVARVIARQEERSSDLGLLTKDAEEYGAGCPRKVE
jgi:hypothetical protein